PLNQKPDRLQEERCSGQRPRGGFKEPSPAKSLLPRVSPPFLSRSPYSSGTLSRGLRGYGSSARARYWATVSPMSITPSSIGSGCSSASSPVTSADKPGPPSPKEAENDGASRVGNGSRLTTQVCTTSASKLPWTRNKRREIGLTR